MEIAGKKPSEVALVVATAVSLLILVFLLRAQPYLLLMGIGAVAVHSLLVDMTFGTMLLISTFFLPIPALEDVSATQLLGIAATGVFLVRFVVLRRAFEFGQLFSFLILFLIAMGISYNFASSLTLGYHYATKYVKDIILYLLLVNLIDDSRKLKLALIAMVIPLFVNNIVGIQQFFFEGLARAKGIIDQPNGFGFYSALVCPLSIYFLRGSSRRKIWRFVFILGLTGVLISVSRGALISLALVILLMIIYERRARILSPVLLGLIIGGTIVLAAVDANPLERFSTVGLEARNILGVNPDPYYHSERAAITRAALDIWSESPLYGVGPGNVVWAHNMYLQVLAEVGIIGLSIVAIMIFRMFYIVRQDIVSAQKAGMRKEVVLLGKALMFTALLAFVQGASSGNIYHIHLYIFMAMLAAYHNIIFRRVDNSR